VSSPSKRIKPQISEIIIIRTGSDLGTSPNKD